MTPLEITDADKKAALDFLEPFGYTTYSAEIGIFTKGLKYGKTQGALAVIKVLESDGATDFQIKENPGHIKWAAWLREKLGI